MKVGIGISTYGRRDVFRDCIGSVNEYTRDDTVVVISDDGSLEGPPDAEGNTLLSNPNGGIARNKNRLLANLFEVQNVDVAILLEDDVRPTVHNWEDPWALVGLINGAAFWTVPALGVWTQGQHMSIGSQCSAQLLVVSREAFNKVGYFDPCFTGYGFEHCEWQRRLARAGMGGIEREGGETTYISYDFQNVENMTAETTGSQEKIDEMWPIFTACHNDTGWKNAWIDEEDRLKFYAESGVGFPFDV